MKPLRGWTRNGVGHKPDPVSRINLKPIGEPLGNAIVEIDAVFHWATTKHQVRATRVSHELRLNALFLEGNEEFVTLSNRAAIVSFAMEDECWRSGIADMRTGAALHDFRRLFRIENAAVPLNVTPNVADI